jgi:GNAT superfamily N-acetyltransferase
MIEIVDYTPELEQWYVFIHNEGFAGWDTSYAGKRSARPDNIEKTFLAKVDGLYVGLIDLVKRNLDGEEVLTIDPLGVLPDFRRHGIGKKLVDSACQWAIDNKFDRMLAVLVNGEPRQHKFYRNSGFRSIDFRLEISRGEERRGVSPDEYNQKYLDWKILHFTYHYMRPLAAHVARNPSWEIMK